MKLTCKSCRSPILPQDINLEMAIAKCTSCGEVFSFLEQVGSEAVAKPMSQLPAPKPFRFVVEEFGSELTVSYRWFTPMLFFMIFFCLFWDAFMAVWYFIAISQILIGQPAAWAMAAFGLLHLAIGIGVTYSTIAGFVNRTVIKVAGGTLTVRHGPMRWGGNHTLNVDDILQFYCSDRTHSSRRRQWSSYQLNVLKKNGTKLVLLGSLTEREEALFLEERLEEKLGIAARQVPGELRS
ncbi:MAG: hypothetical protein ACKVP0_24920 [Pirellulaceae bacterium]